ncbi:leucine-rich repeat-containing protein 59 [Xylocopa sonorina]|uniref:leucine-rich repeat-containing protein 59 n=1 Tax=Xylocopa sonorina TaxID=1818115 RepID=UPI00403AEE8A
MNLKSVKDRLKDETLDLSLCDLKEVPVREIATIKKATHLDLSNNLLTSLPSTFVDLKQIVKLDLSRNMLTEIPINFGELKQLKYLDLYANQISRLPLSLSELKNLRWLDLKENPLTPAVASVAGPCSNLSECQACARNIVSYLSHIKLTIEEEKLRRLNALASTETDTGSTKKGGKKKKKKSIDKQNLDMNESNSIREVHQVENKVNFPSFVDNKNLANKGRFHKENAHQFFMSIFFWLSFVGLAIALIVVILPLYSKESELFIKYIEMNTGVPLKAFQKHSIDILYTFTQIIMKTYDDLYYAYEINFETGANTIKK